MLNQRHRIAVVFFSCLFFVFVGLPWLAAGLLVLCLIGWFIFALGAIINNYLIRLPFALAGVVALSAITRLFLFEVYTVPSRSMEDALFPGDNIVVSKLNYGPRLPAFPAEIPWINLFYANKPALAKSHIPTQANRRLGGFSKIKQADIIVFKSVVSNDEYLVKRCIGLPGNLLQIINGRVLINNRFLEVMPGVKPVLKYTGTAAYKNPGPENLGPILVPEKGMQITLNREIFGFYKWAIFNEEPDLYENQGIFYLNGTPVASYTFKQDYYFMMGDNRNSSYDSRFWGFVPEANIEGKAILTFCFGKTNRPGIRLLKY